MSAARKLDTTHGNDEAAITWVGPPAGDIKAVEALFLSFDADLCRAAYKSLGRGGPAPAHPSQLLSAMTSRKGATGRLLAVELIARRGDRNRALDDRGYWPEPLQQLLGKLRTMLEGGADGDPSQ